MYKILFLYPPHSRTAAVAKMPKMRDPIVVILEKPRPENNLEYKKPSLKSSNATIVIEEDKRGKKTICLSRR